jgi:hypothetical protein
MACPAVHCPLGGLHAVHHRAVLHRQKLSEGEGGSPVHKCQSWHCLAGPCGPSVYTGNLKYTTNYCTSSAGRRSVLLVQPNASCALPHDTRGCTTKSSVCVSATPNVSTSAPAQRPAMCHSTSVHARAIHQPQQRGVQRVQRRQTHGSSRPAPSP